MINWIIRYIYLTVIFAGVNLEALLCWGGKFFLFLATFSRYSFINLVLLFIILHQHTIQRGGNRCNSHSCYGCLVPSPVTKYYSIYSTDLYTYIVSCLSPVWAFVACSFHLLARTRRGKNEWLIAKSKWPPSHYTLRYHLSSLFSSPRGIDFPWDVIRSQQRLCWFSLSLVVIESK